MKKILILAVVISLVVLALFVFNSRTSHAPSSTTFSPTASSTPIPSVKKNYQIIFQDAGAFPNKLTVKTGEAVTFVNKAASPHWPASGPHPTHTICPGFDSLRGLKTNESYSRTFAQPAVCPFHDHLNAADSRFRGQITVIE